MLQLDLSKLHPSVADEFAKGRHARDVLALMNTPAQQLQLARQNDVDHRSIEGLGRLRLNVSTTAYHYWGRRLGYACWRDEAFVREFERDNPEARVRCGGTRIQVGYTAPVRAVRFQKNYGAGA